MIFFKKTSLGRIGIEETDGFITHLFFEGENIPGDMEVGETPLLRLAFVQLERYLDGQLQNFTLPLKPEGTIFMKDVWQKLLDVPYGQTDSYKNIAAAIGNPKAARAVGMANNRNPIPIFIPCHRIIGANGDLTGYGGGMDIKKKLLGLEGYRIK